MLFVTFVGSLNFVCDLPPHDFDSGHFFCSVIEHDLDCRRVQVGLSAIADIREPIPFVHSKFADSDLNIKPHVMFGIDASFR